jgi:hypothetical protein
MPLVRCITSAHRSQLPDLGPYLSPRTILARRAQCKQSHAQAHTTLALAVTHTHTHIILYLCLCLCPSPSPTHPHHRMSVFSLHSTAPLVLLYRDSKGVAVVVSVRHLAAADGSLLPLPPEQVSPEDALFWSASQTEHL